MEFLTCKAKIIIALYSANEALYLSEIASMIGEPKESVRQELLKLNKVKIVDIRKRGPKLKFYFLQPEFRTTFEQLERELKKQEFESFEVLCCIIP